MAVYINGKNLADMFVTVDKIAKEDEIMTKTNEKIHVLADESLGGIKREYVEVDRKAEVGDYVYYGKTDNILTVVKSLDSGILMGEHSYWAANGTYRVLEPTNIVHIDGERYEMVDREAKVGEKIVIVDAILSFGKYCNGDIFDVATKRSASARTACGKCIYDEEYRVLVPAESSEEEPQPSDPIDVIANLATRVAELERENKRIKEDLGWNEMGPGRIAELRNADSDIRHAIAALEERVDNDYEEYDLWSDHAHEKMSRLQDEIDTLHKDIRTIGEELESLKYAAKETDGKVAHLESDSDTRLFTAEEVIALLNEMRERQ
ncbi:hypothetical protein MOF49_16045 [Bacillus haynesii]|nr:hypothetical protein [Bacillus haynesii]MCY9435157.1 hypothetical protein [Bacillus haynesii]